MSKENKKSLSPLLSFLIEAEAKKLVPEKFHKWIKVFGKKQSERMPTRKV